MNLSTHLSLALLPLALLLALPAFGQNAADTHAPPLVQAANAFAADLYARLAAEKGNLFFSPFSIDTVLAMTWEGAHGQTAQQMARALHLDLDPRAASPAYGQLLKTLNTQGKQGNMTLDLVVANALWGQKGYPFHEDFRQRLGRDYRATLQEVDFAHATEQARGTINGWAENQTHQKIQDLIAPDVLTPLTRLVLTNAIYFKSQWAEQFNKALTQDMPFYPGFESQVTVPMMHRIDHYGYLAGEGFAAVELPYRGHELSMTIVLPNPPDGLLELEKKLTADNLGKWFGQLPRHKVDLYLPRFKTTSKFRLAETLVNMGMPDAFDPSKADFSGIATAEKLSIQDVIQKAYVAVDEEGTEAAAATATAMVAAALQQPEQPVVFKADHPFVFLIKDRTSSVVLFMGRMVNPKQ